VLSYRVNDTKQGRMASDAASRRSAAHCGLIGGNATFFITDRLVHVEDDMTVS